MYNTKWRDFSANPIQHIQYEMEIFLLPLQHIQNEIEIFLLTLQYNEYIYILKYEIEIFHAKPTAHTVQYEIERSS